MTDKKYIMPEHTKRTLDSGRICSGCGGKLEGIKIVDNSGNPTIWASCKYCERFDNGVTEQVYKIAVKLFDSGERYYYHMSEGESENEKEYYKSSQLQGLTRLVSKVLNLNEKPRP